MQLVRDNDNKEYELILDETVFYAPCFYLYVHDPFCQKARVGYVNCWIVGTQMSIQDLHICKSHILVFRKPRCLGFFSSTRRETRDFRGRGLGTVLLTSAINYARSKGIDRIEGNVVQKDLVENPYLLKWYGKVGFNTSSQSKIHMNLR